MSLYDQHLEESKTLITKRASKILLDEGDLDIDNRMFAAVYQKIENFQLFDYLLDLANERLEVFENLINDEALSEKYKNELILFLQKVCRDSI